MLDFFGIPCVEHQLDWKKTMAGAAEMVKGGQERSFWSPGNRIQGLILALSIPSPLSTVLVCPSIDSIYFAIFCMS